MQRNTLLGIYRSLAPSNDTLSSTATQEKKDEHSQVKSISQNKEPADEDDEESSWGDEEWDEQLDVVTRVRTANIICILPLSYRAHMATIHICRSP